MLNNFRLIGPDEIRSIQTPAIYALCFEYHGLLARVGWTKYPSSRLPTLLRELIEAPKEIWVGEFKDIFVADGISTDKLGYFARQIQRIVGHKRSHNEFFRVTMTELDAAFDEAIHRPY